MNVRLLLSILVCLHMPLWSGRPTTLNDYRAWFATIPEVAADSHGVETLITDPTYASYVRAQAPGLVRWFLIKFGLIQEPWNLSWVIEPIDRIAERYVREQQRAGSFGFTVKKGDEVVIFGNLHGSIFSFMRDLDELEKRGLIDNQLVLAKNCSCIFLGDIINYSPHTFELLDLVCTILEKNPDRTIYIANEQESPGFRDNLVAMRQQLIQWSHLWGSGVVPGAQMPFHDELNKFFDALPARINLRHAVDKEHRVLCSGQEPEVSLIESPSIAAIIMGEVWGETTWINEGLEFFGFNKGAAFWSLISCPNRFYQDVLNFHYDSFLILHVGPTFKESVLEFVRRDINGKGPFESQHLSLTLAFMLERGPQLLSLPTMYIGSNMSLTGPLGVVGKGSKAGLEAACVHANREGGVNGSLIHPITLDDVYIPRITLRNLAFLKKEYGIDMLVAPQGTPTLQAYLDQIRAGNYYVFFPITGGEQFQLPDISHIIHYRKSYPQEVLNLVDLICKKYTVNRFALVYQNDVFGQQLARAAHVQLRKHGIDEWTDIPFEKNELLLTSQVKKLLNSGAEAIGFFFASNSIAQDFLTKVGGAFLIGKHLFAISFLDTPLFRGFLTQRGLKFTFSYVCPDPFKGDIPIVQEYLDEMNRRQHREVGGNSLDGYIAASLFIEGARHVTKPVTGEKIMRWLESLKDYKFKGLHLTFHPETRSFELPTWIRTEDDQWIREQ